MRSTCRTGRLPLLYAGTNAQLVANAPGPSLTQWPAVVTTSRLLLEVAAPEQT